MYKYFEISDENMEYIKKFKEQNNIKSDKAAFNQIIEEHRKQKDSITKISDSIMQAFTVSYGPLFTRILSSMAKSEETISVLKDVSNTFLVREGIENCILTDVYPSPVIQQSKNHYEQSICEAKQKKDNSRHV